MMTDDGPNSPGKTPKKDTFEKSGQESENHYRKQNSSHTAKNNLAQSNDSAWKDIIEELVEDFFAFFFPALHADIDFTREVTFLDKELQKIIRESIVGKRYVDKLVKVFLKNGKETWLLIHVEVQGYKEENFAERMYIYNYRIFDRYKRDVISLGILTDTDKEYMPENYSRSGWGFRMEMAFPVVKLINYRDKVSELEADDNPFALVVLSFLNYINNRGDLGRLYDVKKSFLHALFEKGFDKHRIRALTRFIE